MFTESQLTTVLLYDHADERFAEVSWVGRMKTHLAFQCRDRRQSAEKDAERDLEGLWPRSGDGLREPFCLPGIPVRMYM